MVIITFTNQIYPHIYPQLESAQVIILAELTKRVNTVFPAASVRVKRMQANAVKSDCTKTEKEKLNQLVEEMFEESDLCLGEG